MNEFIQSLSTLDPIWIYITIFLFAFIENIFPPLPSDTIVVFGGALAAVDKGHFSIALFSATMGSTLGFITMYGAGKWFGQKIIETGKLKFIQREGLNKLEIWYRRYGYWLVVGNRFLSGTRAVISFFAGISQLNFSLTFFLSLISSLFWNIILVYAGYSLGGNWAKVAGYLHSYSYFITIGVVIIVIVFIVRYFYLKNVMKKKNG